MSGIVSIVSDKTKFFFKVFFSLWLLLIPASWLSTSYFFVYTFTFSLLVALYVWWRYRQAIDGRGVSYHRNILYGPLLKQFRLVTKRLNQYIFEAQAEKNLLNATLDVISDGVIVLNQKRRIEYVNSSAKKLCDMQKLEYVGKYVEEVIPIPAIQELSRSDTLFDQPTSRSFSVFYRQEEKYLLLKSRPFGDSAEASVVLIVKDLSESRQHEQSHQEFIANASHDLKTPLTVIRGYVDALKEGTSSEVQQQKFLEKISSNVDRMTKLSHDLLQLTVTQPLSSREGLRVNLSEVLTQHLEGYQSMAQAKGLSFESDIERDLMASIPIESIETMVGNLLDNAVKYSYSQGVVSLKLKRQKYEAILEVADQGVGISQAEQSKIFYRFYRSDKTRNTEGFGLGLSIVKKIVEDAGGQISVESRPRKGTKFLVKLPLLR